MAVALPPFQSLLDEHGLALWRFVRASLPEPDAADCYQEAMLAALRSYPSLTRDDNLRSWLFTIAHHKAIDHHRRVARRRLTSADLPDAADDRAPDPADAGPDATLWAAVDELPPKQRAAVLQRFVADLPYAEIAAVIGCSEAAARQSVRVGLATLRRHFAVPQEA